MGCFTNESLDLAHSVKVIYNRMSFSTDRFHGAPIYKEDPTDKHLILNKKNRLIKAVFKTQAEALKVCGVMIAC